MDSRVRLGRSPKIASITTKWSYQMARSETFPPMQKDHRQTLHGPPDNRFEPGPAGPGDGGGNDPDVSDDSSGDGPGNGFGRGNSNTNGKKNGAIHTFNVELLSRVEHRNRKYNITWTSWILENVTRKSRPNVQRQGFLAAKPPEGSPNLRRSLF
ncbi:uncharacterized protein BCR38DRAFT_413086 [Pseudomassariella vexata]|uniref:Uncharacterized protein n=1 Tax=Pseudomassariella vexata TaxID=1141098 RepID=A0A1Y2DHQ1_9PEZI|nr:uncharacterized protein BCR38DRAFT_413086 [Pseudomassariella vexata]ORY58768.1 hypothetical protein BCR38DRAFT_413086 [Pseudomassariella vexata]